MPKYEFVEHTADVTFKAYGRGLNELFENAAEALESTLVRLEGVAPSETATIEMSSDSYENLLYDWLAELLVTIRSRTLCCQEVYSQDYRFLAGCKCRAKESIQTNIYSTKK